MPEIQSSNPTIKSLDGLHLWHAPMSSCSQRVRIVLAETGKSFVSHLVNLEKDEHATEEYQAIHPKGLVPAFVDDGKLFIESIDIIQQIAGAEGVLSKASSPELLTMADEAQMDLKLLTFEFLFRSGPPPGPEAAAAFQRTHQNDWLKQFRIDFVNGFDKTRIDDAVNRTMAGFCTLDAVLSDERSYLGGNEFSLSDVAWMPNVHRFELMQWPFERTPYLKAWFDRVSTRPSYKAALLDWQPPEVSKVFAEYTLQRREQGTDVRAFGHFNDAD